MTQSNIGIIVANGPIADIPPYDDYIVIPWNSVMQAALLVPFTSLAGTVIDPDIVTFTFTPPGIALSAPPTPIVFTYTYGNAPPDPTYTIVRGSVGNYSANLDNSSYPQGVWEVAIEGSPGGGHDTTKTKVSFTRYFIVD